MKIVILANNDIGLYLFRRELLAELLKEHHVVIALPGGEYIQPLEEMGCRFIHTPMERRGMNPVADMGLICRYWNLLRREKPNMMISYTIKPNIYGGMVCRMLGIPYAANITGLGTAFQRKSPLRSLVTILYRLALKKASVVFFENRDSMKTLLDEKIVVPDQCNCLNGAGVNLEHYRQAEYPRYDVPVHFLFVGRVMAEKGINELFESMKRLVAEGCRCKLDILGYSEEDYADQIAEYTKQGWLNYWGFQADVRPFIAESHCFVLPSWHEGMANTNLECAAMGRPLITSNIHGCKEAVVENVSGLLCQPKDADSLYRAMKRFLAMSPEERAAMGRAGRVHMENVFDKRKVVEKTIKGLGL